MRKREKELTPDRSHHKAEVGLRGQLGRTPRSTCCRVPARRRRAVRGGQPGCVCTRLPHSRRAPGSDETLDDRPGTYSRSVHMGCIQPLRNLLHKLKLSFIRPAKHGVIPEKYNRKKTRISSSLDHIARRRGRGYG